MNNTKKRLCKLCNNGFSLIELIIVVAIMAVLVGVISPQYIKWVEKSRESTDVTNMKTVETAALCLYLDGGLTTVANTSYYDSDSNTIIDEKPKKGYGKGTTSDLNTTYIPNSCSYCSYEPSNSYDGAYLNVYYDESGKYVHTHWIDTDGNAIIGKSQTYIRGKKISEVIQEAVKNEIFGKSGNNNPELNSNQVDSPAIGYGQKITNYVNEMTKAGLELPDDVKYWAYKQVVDKNSNTVQRYYVVWTDEDIASKKTETDTVKVIQYDSKTNLYSVGYSKLKTSSTTLQVDGQKQISYNTVYDVSNITKSTAFKPTSNLDEALKYYEEYLKTTN